MLGLLWWLPQQSKKAIKRLKCPITLTWLHLVCLFNRDLTHRHSIYPPHPRPKMKKKLQVTGYTCDEWAVFGELTNGGVFRKASLTTPSAPAITSASIQLVAITLSLISLKQLHYSSSGPMTMVPPPCTCGSSICSRRHGNWRHGNHPCRCVCVLYSGVVG